MLEDRARDELADPLPLESEPLDQAAQRGGEQLLVGGLCVRAVGARERNAAAADDRDPAGLWECEGIISTNS